jgi:integrase
VKDRTKADDVRALALLTEWCVWKGYPATLEAIDDKRAYHFADDLSELTGGLSHVTQNKYLSRLSGYWKYLVKRTPVPRNVFYGVKVEGEPTPHDQLERAFEDDEVRRLLSGATTQHMKDLMAIGALTGARLDAIVDMKVKDTIDGALTFKPQKKEPAPRDIPIHPALQGILARRTAGKEPHDDLFPEWPKPKKVGSQRERSFKASNQFTEYRKTVGVNHVIEGRRRALTNFHSFRRWFITKMERTGAPESLIAAIVGHKRPGITLGRYSEGPDMKAARKAIAKIALPPLDAGPIPEARTLRSRRRLDKAASTE